MKALICSINTKYVHSSLAAWCLAAGIEKYASEVEYEVYETTVNDSIENIKNEIEKRSFDIIGFCTYIWNLKYVNELCEYVKNRKIVKTVLGGPEVAHNIEENLQKEYVDYIISGEGELSFAKLCKGEPVESIEGLSYKVDKKIKTNPTCKNLSTPPYPYVKKYFESLNGRIAYIETSRGCPFNCTFCLSGKCGEVVFFDIEESKRKILDLANSGAKTIKFVDRTFNADKKRSKEIFKFVISNYGTKIPCGICFHFEIEASILDSETIEILKNAPIGLIQLEIGIQSFNPKTLEAINRKRDQVKLVENIKKLILCGNMHIHVDLIAGLPYEDLQSFEQSFNQAYGLEANMLQLGFLKVLHGSSLKEKIELYNLTYDKKPPYEVKETAWMSAETLSNLHTCEDIFERMYNSGRFPRTCKYLVEKLNNPFKMYWEFSLYVKEKIVSKSNTLDDFTEIIYNYFSSMKEIDKNKLRDEMVKDRLSTNRMGVVPEFLKCHSFILKKALLHLEKDEKTKKPKGIKRAVARLLTEEKIIYVDYINQNPVTKQFRLCELDINDI